MAFSTIWKLRSEAAMTQVKAFVRQAISARGAAYYYVRLAVGDIICIPCDQGHPKFPRRFDDEESAQELADRINNLLETSND